MSRRRRRTGFARAVEPMGHTKADSTDPQTILETIALGATNLPALDVYWMLYEKHPWVAACVNLISNTVAGDGFDIVAAREMDATDVSKDSRVPQIREFWDQGFVGKITYRRAMFALAVDLKVFAKGYWRKRRMGKLLLALERIDPRCVLPRPNAARTEIETFLVRKRQPMEQSVNSLVGTPLFNNAERVDPADIVFFTLGGGDQLLGAPSPLEHLDYTIGLDLAIRRHRQSFFQNGAVTGKIIALKNGRREDARELEMQIRNTKRGPENAYKTWVVAGDAVIADRGNDAGEQDIDFVKGSGINRDEVCAVYHVPPGKLLFASGALGSAGKAEDDQTFQEQCVLPLEEAIYEIINRDVLQAEFGIEDLAMAPQRRSTLRFDMFPTAESGVQVGMTGNEARKLVNLPPITDPQYNMDAPLFLNTKGMGIASDIPTKEPAPTDPAVDGDVNDTNDAIDANDKRKRQGVAKTGAKGKALRY